TSEIAIRVAEALLGFVETFFATSLTTDAIPHRQNIHVGIFPRRVEDAQRSGLFEAVLTDPEYLVRIEFSPRYDRTTELTEGALRSFLRDLLGLLSPRILYVPDFEKYFGRIAGVEEGFGRSLSFSDIFTSASNVVGNDPIFELSQWMDDDRYPLKRTHAVSLESSPKAAKGEAPKFGTGEVPERLMDAT